uniref:Uncharacterized protein n=1 Tax=Arundo donax TaxID=35708 RepID=A0A0A9E2D3_ARUDO
MSYPSYLMAVQVCQWSPLNFVWFLHSTTSKLCGYNCVCFLYLLAICCNCQGGIFRSLGPFLLMQIK